MLPSCELVIHKYGIFKSKVAISSQGVDQSRREHNESAGRHSDLASTCMIGPKDDMESNFIGRSNATA